MGAVISTGDIAALAAKLLRDPAEASRLGDAAARGAATLGGAVARTIEVVDALLAHAHA